MTAAQRTEKYFQYIIFDLDGTLTDPRIGITKSIAYALQNFDIEVKDLKELNQFIGPPLKDTFMHHYGFNEIQALQAIEKYREYYIQTGMYENRVYQGIETLLQELYRQGKTLLIATSKPRIFAIQILKHFRLSQYFTDICGSELDSTRIQKVEVIQHVFSENHITDLSLAVMVGDRKHDIIGAKKAGIHSVGVLYGYGNLEEMLEAKADDIVSSVAELHSILSGAKLPERLF